MNTSITRNIRRLHSNGHYMKIELELRRGHERLSDGFSVTGVLPGYGFGMLHEEILECAPELAPVIAVHLADPDGVPIHAVANGWYFYSGKARQYEEDQVESGNAWYAENYERSDHERAAAALHIPVEDLPTGLDREGFETFAQGLRPRWKEQARVALEIIENIK